MHSKKITVRFASAISAAVIGFTSTAISFFDCPVYAAYGGAAWGEFFGFYSLLEGFGFGQDNTDFINSVDNWIDSLKPEEKPREDYDGEWMTDAQYWQQCQYDKFTGWLDNLIDSWSESYDAVGDFGSDVPASNFVPGALSSDGKIFRLSADAAYSTPLLLWSGNIRFSDGTSDDITSTVKLVSDDIGTDDSYMLCKNDVIYLVTLYNKASKYGFRLDGRYNVSLSSGNGYHNFTVGDVRYQYDLYNYSLYYNGTPIIRYMLEQAGISLVDIGSSSIQSFFSDIGNVSFSDLATSGGFIGPVYTYPAAQELARQNKTSTGIRLDVKTADGAPDVKAALDGAGVSTVDELAASVAAGDVAMQDVFADAKVTPYVVADTTTGVVVTDLGVAADAAGVKPVALTKELTVPADLTAAATYAIQGKTWDPDMAKYRLPLFQYFPFCLPWDIYQVLSAFSADPVAPQIEIPIGKFFANKKSFDGSAVANYTETLDLGDEKFSKWFSALRLLESAGIIIGLVLISVHLIHGGR